MKRKLVYGLLAIEAVLCVFLCLWQAASMETLVAAMTFPFEQIGGGLRLLSLCGRLGNAAAWMLYAVISLIPIWVLLYRKQKRKLQTEDALLVLLALLLLATLYLGANPERMGAAFGIHMFCGAVYVVLIGYLVLLSLRLLFESDLTGLRRCMGALLVVLAGLFVFAVFGGCLYELLAAIEQLRTGNAGNENALGISYAFLILRYLVSALPYGLNLGTVFFAVRLLGALEKDRYGEAAVEQAERLARWCGKSLSAVVLAGIGFHLLQLLFAKALLTISSQVVIPVLSMVFVLCVLLFARLIAENRLLKQDSDSII